MGDIINAGDHNDILPYIESGTYRTNTLSLNIGGTEVITSARIMGNITNATITQTTVTGAGLSVIRDLASASTDSALVSFVQDNAGDDQNALTIQNEGSGPGLYIDQNGNGRGLQLVTIATTAIGMNIYNNAVFTGTDGFARFMLDSGSSTGNVVNIVNDGTGVGLHIDQNGNATALHIDTASTVTAPLRITSTASNPTGAHIIGDIAVVAGKLKICTTAGTPGTWTVVGTQTSL